jgi:aminopeptidase N
VRIEASASLRKIHSDAALEALIGSVAQPDARVRNAVAGDIAGFFHPRAREALSNILGSEKNPAIVATAVRGLGAYHGPGVRETLLGFLRTSSFRDEIAVAAIAAMRAQDDTAYLAPLREALSRPEAGFSSRDFGQGLDAFAYLGRNEKAKDPLREFLAGFINHKRERIQTGAMKALGTLEDPKAISLLETFAVMPKETPQRQEADKAIAALRAVNRPGDNLKDLRQEVLELRRAKDDLKKELDDLKKRVEAASARETEKTTGK